ncbi:MAG: class I SAM-dependent methyltransferase, partial [Candidatus Acidiferrum sp.]
MSEEKALYDCFIADYYDSAPMVTQRTHDVAFYANAAKKYGDPVLELGCGTGRITVAIAEAGYRIVGLDIPEKMLERAAEKRTHLRREARERLHLVQGDMARFDLGEQFRTVVIPFRPFQHLLETEQQMDCLNCAREHLVPGGYVILDF